MSPVTILSFDFPAKDNALSGQYWMHFGFPWQVSHMMTFRLFGCIVTAPYSQASMHQPQPLHLPSSKLIIPVSFDCDRAFFGHEVTHGAFLHVLHVTTVLKVCPIRIERMRDFNGLKTFSFSKEQAYSQMSQPTHFSVSQLTYWLTMFKA